MGGFGWILDLLFPPRCAACQVRTRRVAFCAACETRLPPAAASLCTICGLPVAGTVTDHACARCTRRPPHFARARACTSYRRGEANPLIEVLRRHKYGRDITCAPVLAGFLATHAPLVVDHDLIVPVPLHRRRLRWRGFNQSALLAVAIARQAQRPVDVWTLARAYPTPPQVGLGEADRRRNVAGAFIVRQPPAVDGRTILLIDDVMTTGATADECARVLRRAGAQRVEVLVVARALDHT